VLKYALVVAFALSLSLPAQARGPSLKITNRSGRMLKFDLKVAGAPNWDAKQIRAGASEEYWATNQRSRIFEVRIGTVFPNGRVVSRSYRLEAGFSYFVTLVNGVWDFRKDASVKGPALTIRNTGRMPLVFRMRADYATTWDPKTIGAGATNTYWAGDQRSTQFFVEISTRCDLNTPTCRRGQIIKKSYRLQAGFRYEVRLINGVWDFRRF